ncbi:alpha-L-fucosidase [Paenibacillus gansuensis]|uniref:alpha-L-fucosidase n=1 Tax=Paenibacillus gansuensis TaxID=306542 RepID=A0ABW5PB22_9BACL
MFTDIQKARMEWSKLRYGMFIHFGPNTFEGTGWGSGAFPAGMFAPANLDVSQWAQTAVEAGMKYAVLTAKHHDGFCLWPSEHTDYSVRHSPAGIDIVGAFAEEFRKAGLQVGLYYSLWDRNYPDYEDDEKYARYMKLQITELLTEYGDLVELWFDGGWDKEHPTREWPYQPEWETMPDSGFNRGERWRWESLYHLIHELQPGCLVINNSSSDRPGQVRYMPVDVRTAEHFHYIWQEQECMLPPASGDEHGLPLEFCTSLNPDWFWTGRSYPHPGVAAIREWYGEARRHGGNLLLNVGPNRDGLIPEYHRAMLKQAKI